MLKDSTTGKEYILRIPRKHGYDYICGGTYMMDGDRCAVLTDKPNEAKRFKTTKKAHSFGRKLLRKCKNINGYNIVEV